MPYGKSNKSIQDSAFAMRSGNSPLFKAMGSSPARTEGHGGAEDHTHDNEEEEMLQADEVDLGRSWSDFLSPGDTTTKAPNFQDGSIPPKNNEEDDE